MQHQHLDDAPVGADLEITPIVLHVEDDRDFSAALRYRLEAHGVAVVRAFDAEDGLHQSKSLRVDAILIDFELPGANGDWILKSIRQCESTKSLPVIVLTGRQDMRLKRRLMKNGATAYLTKPLKFDDLRKELAPHIPILSTPYYFLPTTRSLPSPQCPD